jgi:restriction system protein
MKFKMSEKSLFAILLRSPWWVSFLIGALLVLLTRVFLPENLRALGMLSALPFCVLGVLAAWKQRNQASPESVSLALTHLAKMSLKEFLPTIEKSFAQQGFVVTRLNLAAADFRLEKSGRVTLVSCKRWKAASLGVEVLRDLKALQTVQAVDHAACISLSLPTGVALQFSKDNEVQLICQDELVSLYLQSMKDQVAV